MDVEFLRYQFEDRHDGVVVKNKFKLGVRHIQMTYMLLCAMSLGALRGSTGIAVLALTDVNRRNESYVQMQDWDVRVQGTVLSSFLFGYALMLIPAELFMQRVSAGKHLLTGVLIISGSLAVAMPTVVKKGGWIAACNAQLWLGAAQACLAPSNQSLLIRFLPPNERSFFGFLVHSGSLLGILVGLPISGLLSEARLGWELIYYSQAMLTLSVACLCALLTASSPEQHQAMGDSEKDFIKEALNCYRKRSMIIPWRSILKTPQFWATACAHAASNAIFVFFLFYVPAYLQNYGVSLKVSSWQASLPFAALWLVRVTAAPTADWFCRVLRVAFQFNLSTFRKLVNGLGASGVAGALTVLPNLSPEWRTLLVLVILTGTLGILGFQFSGFLETHKDMSENYSGSLLMLSRAAAGVVGAFVPLVVGFIIGDNMNDLHRWHTVFLTLASLYVLCNVVYSASGSSERQHWDGGTVMKSKFGYHNTMIDTNHLEMEELKHSKINQQNDSDTGNTEI